MEGILSDTAKPFIIPVLGLIAGAVMMALPKLTKKVGDEVGTAGKLVLYFGAQSFMNIYMGWVMRTHVTVPKGVMVPGATKKLEADLTGCPAGFALTAFQQIISFIIFMIFLPISWLTPWPHQPKKLNGSFEIFCVVIFGCVFALNIALNNFSLGYISIAVNLIIRSCLPLTTFLSSQGLAALGVSSPKPCRWKEIGLMVIGVFCAGAFTMAQILGSAKKSESNNMILGVIMCIASLLCGSLNLALAGLLGEIKLNVMDTVAYMAIPATVFLAPIALFLQKPVPGEWKHVFNTELMSDFQILAGTWSLNKETIMWLVLSGVFSFGYNIIQFTIVHTLSPSATAFGGNFNKAALVFLTLLLPFLRVHELPGSPWIEIIWLAVIINIAAFSYYSYLQIKAKQEEKEEKDKAKNEQNERMLEDGDESKPSVGA